MKKINILFFLVLIVFMSCSSEKFDKESIQDTILSIIKQQQTAWNNHDIQGFMADYWHSEDLTFQSGGQRLYGWDKLLKRYQTSYAGEKMGELTFSDTQIKVLSPEYVYALGRWKVEQDNNTKSGVFTIIFKLFPSGWKIIHDHSS